MKWVMNARDINARETKNTCVLVIFSSGFRDTSNKNADLYDGFIHRGVIVCALVFAYTMYIVHTVHTKYTYESIASANVFESVN